VSRSYLSKVWLIPDHLLTASVLLYPYLTGWSVAPHIDLRCCHLYLPFTRGPGKVV